MRLRDIDRLVTRLRRLQQRLSERWMCEGREMNWLTSNVLWLAGIGLVLFVSSFVRFREVFGAPNWWVLGVGVFFLLLALPGAYWTFYGPPGSGPVIVEPDDGKEKDPASLRMNAVQRLQATWNSEEAANWPVSETLAQFSEIAYSSPVDASKEFQILGFDTCMPVIDGSMAGYVVSADDVTVIVFRGTDFKEMSDWFTNFQRKAASTPHGGAHGGFYGAYQKLRGQIREIVTSRKPKHLWVTGHSLGGALALLCASDLAEEGTLPFAGLMTFGQPLMVRTELADYLNNLLAGKYARFVNRDDIVARVDPGYSACGSLVWFTPERVYRSGPSRLVTGAAAGEMKSPSINEFSPEAAPTDDGNPPGSESEDGYREIAPLSESEFQNLLKDWNSEAIKAIDEPLVTDPAAENAETDAEGAVRSMAVSAGFIPQRVQDHYMSNYLDEIRRHLGVTLP